MTAPKPKQVVIDAFVLACSNSPLRDVVGTDALRSVLDFEWRQLTARGSFDLQLVWETFESQPGFDPEVAVAPICRFKSWQSQLGLTIELPTALRNLSEAEQHEMAERCQVPAAELQRVLRAAGAPEPAVGAGRSKRATGGGKADRAAPSGGRTDTQGAATGRASLTFRRRPVLAVAIAVAAVATLGLAAYQAIQGFGGGAKWKEISIASVAGELPVADAQRFGDQVKARLTDASWLGQDRQTRQDQLEQALDALARRGVTVLFLEDDDGRVRAIAQRWGNPPRIRVTFR